VKLLGPSGTGLTQLYNLSVRLATTANHGLSGLTAIDGVTPVSGDRILVKNNTTASQNGPYIAASGTWTRATDADTSAKVVSGQLVYIEEGAQAGQLWVLTTANTITLGSTSLTYTRLSVTSAAGRQSDSVYIDYTPSRVYKIHGDGSANARGLTFSAGTRNMYRLRIAFRVDVGNNHNLRVRLYKYDIGTTSQIVLATASRSNGADGNTTSGNYFTKEQLISAGSNPTELSIESGDTYYFVVDSSSGGTPTGVSQITVTVESDSV
jgi:hypothetical protein